MGVSLPSWVMTSKSWAVIKLIWVVATVTSWWVTKLISIEYLLTSECMDVRMPTLLMNS